MATKKTTKKRTPRTKKEAVAAKRETPPDPVQEALRKVLRMYFQQDILPKMEHEAKKVVSTWVGNSFARVTPSIFGIEITLTQKLGFGREVSGKLELQTDIYSYGKGSLLEAVKDGIKDAKGQRMDKGYYVGKPILDAMKTVTDVNFGCGSRTATEALGQAEQIRVISHALLALETYLMDFIGFRTIGDAILSELSKPKVEEAAEETTAAV